MWDDFSSIKLIFKIYNLLRDYIFRKAFTKKVCYDKCEKKNTTRIFKIKSLVR